ncbi:hypothetical protein LIER_39272 [Lithospermum erythrorhizon]|uniref:Pentatricopeptide repeat-containing protein n=1 Tax=Lithospermum erythrorhizon TaxID=34254 RepID=A0AAV3QDV5_LITER
MSSSSLASRLHGIFSKTSKLTSATTSLATTKKPPPTSPIVYPLEVDALVNNFNEYSNSSNFRRRKHHYEIVVHRLAKGNHFSAIETILEHQKKYKQSMADEGFAVRLIMLYGKSCMFDHAYKVFDEMPQYNCPRTVVSFNALLSACVKSKNLDKIREIFTKVREDLGVEPNVISYNLVIKALCELKEFDSAMKLLEEMEESAICPDSVSYNTIFEAYHRENNLDEAEKLWRKMEEKGVIANARTFNAKLRILIGDDRVQEALELIENMVNGEVKPDKFSYNAVIKGCVGSGKLEEAKMLHGKMGRDGCLPDHTTFAMLIPFACDKGDIDFSLSLCKQAVELQVSVYKSLMQRVINTLIEKSKIDEANELVALLSLSKKHRYTLILPVTE